MKPLKRFGQNYLVDKNIQKKIVASINLNPDDLIIEIGPGHGALTELIYPHYKNYLAIEIDNRVIDELKNKFSGINLINDDFLNLDIEKMFLSYQNKIRFIGNIPYNITSPILFKLIEKPQLVKDVTFLVQYEVAKRITASIGKKDYSILSVVLQYFADVKFLFKVSPNVFYPRPKVSSALINLNFRSYKQKAVDKLFVKIVKSSFGNRRKTLKNSLSNSIFAGIDFSKSEIDLSLRAEQLTIDQFVKLSNFAYGELNE